MSRVTFCIVPDGKIMSKSAPDCGNLPDHADATAQLFEHYAKRIRWGESPADWPEFPLVMRIAARRI